MTGVGHTRVGISFSILGYYYLFNNMDFKSHLLSILFSFFIIIGATAPDWLEFRKKNGGTLIKHRTITHWLPLWLILFFTSYSLLNGNTFGLDFLELINNVYLVIPLLGFSIGGLLHLFVDFPNPMGIPVFTPYHRFSLHLWKSGKNETAIVLAFLLMSLGFIAVDLDLITINIDF